MILHVQRCEQLLFEKLANLKKLEILNQSLTPRDLTSDFEILEFYGDSALGEWMAFKFMQTKRFMNPSLLTQLKIACVCNANLANVYEQLGLARLLPGIVITDLKAKADVVEAIIGELCEALKTHKHPSHSANIQNVFDQLLGLILFFGEQSFAVTNPQLHVSPPKPRNPDAITSPPKKTIKTSPKKARATPLPSNTGPVLSLSPPKKLESPYILPPLPTPQVEEPTWPPFIIPPQVHNKTTSTNEMKTIRSNSTAMSQPNVPSGSWEELVAWSTPC
jgi:hypothetical protein